MYKACNAGALRFVRPSATLAAQSSPRPSFNQLSNQCILQRHAPVTTSKLHALFYPCSLRLFSTSTNRTSENIPKASDHVKSADSSKAPASPASLPPLKERSSILHDIRDHASNVKHGTACQFDKGLIPFDTAKSFPRIKTTSLSTKRIVISDEASASAVTLVLVAFRSIADTQLKPWRDAFSSLVGQRGQWFDVTINESFAAQALSGFVQRWQRGRTDPSLHDFYVAFNNHAREPLEVLLLSTNRMYGNVLLLDRNARVRFRAYGSPTPLGIDSLLSCASQLLNEGESEKAQQ